MKKMKKLGAPRRGVVWVSGPASSEFPDASDYDNTYVSSKTSPPGRATERPRRAPSKPTRSSALSALVQSYVAVFRHVVFG